MKPGISHAPQDRLLRAHIKLARTLRDTHYGHHVKEYTTEPKRVEFAKHVGNNTPFVVRGYALAWGCISTKSASRWSNKYLTAQMGDTEVSVAITMDGRADAVVELPRRETSEDLSHLFHREKASSGGATVDHREGGGYYMRNDEDTPVPTKKLHVFATPYTARLPFNTALTHLLTTQRHLILPLQLTSPTPPILYLQAQNDCLRSEFPSLLTQLPLPLHPSWVTTVLGTEAEAINLWIGTKHSISTLHSDPYENLYVVVRGRKRFYLTPPGEGWFYCKTKFATASWVPRNSSDQCQEEGEDGTSKVPEVELRPDEPEAQIPWHPVPHPQHIPPEVLERYARLNDRPKPYEVTVEAGDMLYLPRGWLHHVEQEEDEEGLCVAVNSWFDDVDGGMGREWGWGGFVDAVDRILGDEDEEVEDDEKDDEEDENGNVMVYDRSEMHYTERDLV
jgi:jumonji domain-containing protein 7